MIEIRSRISKEEMADMPRVVFPGKIYVVDRPDQVDPVCRFLSGFPLLGIDSETKPSFRKGQVNKVALLQVSTHDTCYLFRLNKVGISLPLIQFLENPSVRKVGLSLKDDVAALRSRTQLSPRGLIDLQDTVHEFGIEDMSLQRIYANLFHEKISKAQQLSNWEAENLTIPQQQYGAIDAWSCLRIHDRLEECRQSGDYRLITVENPVAATAKNQD